MSQICVIGPAEDRTIGAVLAAVLEARVPCSFVDLDEFLLGGSLYFDTAQPHRALLTVGEVELELSRFSGIYCRFAAPAFQGISFDGARRAEVLSSALRVI